MPRCIGVLRRQIVSEGGSRVIGGERKNDHSDFPKEKIRLGAGIDRGFVQCGAHGDVSHREFDINGEPVNCSNRLQEYTKALSSELGLEGSVLVISPYTADYIEDYSAFKRISTEKSPIRNFPLIKWVLVREFSQTSGQTRKAA